jgi:ubiquinone/menaquinone biosynthesis C-methylase UbiE
MSTATAKAYKGMGMEGPIATWYAKNTEKMMDEQRAEARALAAELAPGAKVLEVAPGPGYMAVELARAGCDVTGLDISKSFVKLAAQYAAKQGVRVDFRHGNASAMPFADSTFDQIVCRAAFKNFAQPAQALVEMHRVLRPGGRALIIDMRKNTSPSEIDAYLKTVSMRGMDRLMTKWALRFLLARRAYTRREIEGFIAQTKFQKSEIQESGLGFEIRLEK